MSTPILGIPLLDNQQASADVTHNQAIATLQTLHIGVISVGLLNTPPVSPSEGDTYVIGPGPATGAWVGHENAVAGYFFGQWIFMPGNDENGTPITMGAEQEGLRVWDKSTNASYTWSDIGVSPGNLDWRVDPTSISTLGGLSDTTLNSPTDWDVLIYRDSAWRNICTNTVWVCSTDDLPAPSAGVITLEDNKVYHFASALTLSDRLECGQNNAITAGNPNGPTITYTGSGSFITSVNTNLSVRDIKINAPSGTIVDCTCNESPGGQGVITINRLTSDSCAKFAYFEDVLTVDINDSSCVGATQGVEIVGNNTLIVSLNKFGLLSLNPSFIAIDISNLQDVTALELSDLAMTGVVSGAIGIKGRGNSENVLVGNIATVTSCSFNLTTPLSGISVNDIRWEFSGNSSNVSETNANSLTYMNNNATNTVISAANTPVLVSGTWSEQIADKFTTTSSGRSTSDSERSMRFSIDIAASIAPVSGTNKTMTIYVAINGSIVSASGTQVRGDSGNPLHITGVWLLDMSEGDYVEIFVENNTDTVDILVSDIVLRVR